MEVMGMEEPNLETLIRDLYNHARQNLSEDLVAELLETAKQLPSTNERLLAVRLSGLVTLELLKNPRTPAPELVNLARYIKKEEARYSCLVYKIHVIIKLWHIVQILNNEH